MATPTPTISRILEDRTLIELVYVPERGVTALAIATPDGRTSIEPNLDLPGGERLVPYSADNALIATGSVLLPSDVGEAMDAGELVAATRAFLHRYVDLPEVFEVLAAHYVLLSWVYDAFSDLPYLRFRGDFGTGKTRALMVIGSICYKPFFASGASTVSPIFHIQDAFQGTLVLDEADFRFSDAAAQLTKILNNGTTAGMPVLRTMTNRNRELHPHAFRVFGPKIVAMRERFADLALESRLLTCETGGRTVRDDIPIHLPAAFHAEARDLRNRLLAWRFRSRFSVGPDPSRAAAGVSARYRQSSLALLSLIDDADVRTAITRELAGEEARVLNERADTLEAAMLSAIEASFADASGPHAAVSDISVRFNDAEAANLGRPMSNKWVGGFIRTRLHLGTLKTGGVYVVPATERGKLAAMLARYGREMAPSTAQSP
jgi:hypothetical protein